MSKFFFHIISKYLQSHPNATIPLILLYVNIHTSTQTPAYVNLQTCLIVCTLISTPLPFLVSFVCYLLRVQLWLPSCTAHCCPKSLQTLTQLHKYAQIYVHQYSYVVVRSGAMPTLPSSFNSCQFPLPSSTSLSC